MEKVMATHSNGETHGQRSLVSYSPWGCKESETTEQLAHTHTQSCDFGLFSVINSATTNTLIHVSWYFCASFSKIYINVAVDIGLITMKLCILIFLKYLYQFNTLTTSRGWVCIDIFNVLVMCYFLLFTKLVADIVITEVLICISLVN